MRNISPGKLAFIAMAGAMCAVVEAGAQPAPITYAGRTPAAQTAQTYAALPGGDERSYGYGVGFERRERREEGGVIDLTRPSTPRRMEASAASEASQAASQAPQASPAPAQRPAWLAEERVGPPYEANGRTYVPTPEPGYAETGLASWYGPGFHGAAAANGETYDSSALTAAHPTLPIPSLVQVTNLANNREVIVRVTDRGPFVSERVIDLSRRAAETLGFAENGTARVHVRYLGPAPQRYGASPAAADRAPQIAPQSAPAPVPAAPAPETPVRFSAQPAAPSGAYVVQVGAFSDLQNAHRVRAELESAGEVLVEPRQTASGELFRVRLIGFDSRAEAETARAEIAALGFPEAVVAAR